MADNEIINQTPEALPITEELPSAEITTPLPPMQDKSLTEQKAELQAQELANQKRAADPAAHAKAAADSMSRYEFLTSDTDVPVIQRDEYYTNNSRANARAQAESITQEARTDMLTQVDQNQGYQLGPEGKPSGSNAYGVLGNNSARPNRGAVNNGYGILGAPKAPRTGVSGYVEDSVEAIPDTLGNSAKALGSAAYKALVQTFGVLPSEAYTFLDKFNEGIEPEVDNKTYAGVADRMEEINKLRSAKGDNRDAIAKIYDSFSEEEAKFVNPRADNDETKYDVYKSHFENTARTKAINNESKRFDQYVDHTKLKKAEAELGASYDENKAIFEEGMLLKEAGNETEGNLKIAAALAGFSGDTVANVIRNPAAAVQLIAQSAPEMYLIARKLSVGLTAAFARTFSANLEDLRAKPENKGKILTDKQYGIAAGASAGEAVVSVIGDKVLIGKGNISKSLGFKKSASDVAKQAAKQKAKGKIRKTIEAPIKFTALTTKAGTQEFGEEYTESVLGQIAVEQDVDKIDYKQATIEGQLGFGPGQVMATGVPQAVGHYPGKLADYLTGKPKGNATRKEIADAQKALNGTAQPTPVNTDDTSPAGKTASQYANSFTAADISGSSNATLEAIGELKETPANKAIRNASIKELNRRDADEAGSVESGSDINTYDDADSKLDTAFKTKPTAAEAPVSELEDPGLLTLTRESVIKIKQLENVPAAKISILLQSINHSLAKGDVTPQQKSNLEANYKVATKAAEALNIEVNKRTEEDNLSITASTATAGQVAGNIENATPAQVETASTAVAAGAASNLDPNSQIAILNQSSANAGGKIETKGSSSNQQSLNQANKANAALVNANLDLFNAREAAKDIPNEGDASHDAGAVGFNSTGFKVVHQDVNRRTDANIARGRKAFSTKEAAQLQQAVTNLNDEINERKRALQKDKYTEKVNAVIRAELVQAKAAIAHFEANAKLYGKTFANVKFNVGTIHDNTKPIPAGLDIKQAQTLDPKATNVKLGNKGRSTLFSQLAQRGALSSKIGEDTTGTLASLVGDINFTEEELRLIRETKKNPKSKRVRLPKAVAGGTTNAKLIDSILKKFDAAVRASNTVVGDNLASYIKGRLPDVFASAYSGRNLTDTREVSDFDQKEVDDKTKPTHKPIDAATYIAQGKEDGKTPWKMLNDLYELIPDNIKYEDGPVVSSVDTNTTLEAAINHIVDFINLKKINNAYKNRKSFPISLTRSYNASKESTDNWSAEVSKFFSFGKGEIANNVVALYETMESNSPASLALRGGLSPDQVVQTKEFARLAKEFAGKRMKMITATASAVKKEGKSKDILQNNDLYEAKLELLTQVGQVDANGMPLNPMADLLYTAGPKNTLLVNESAQPILDVLSLTALTYALTDGSAPGGESMAQSMRLAFGLSENAIIPDLLTGAGISQTAMVEALGDRGRSTLGISSSDVASEVYNQIISDSIGNEMVQLMMGNGAMKINTFYVKANAKKSGVDYLTQAQAKASGKEVGNKVKDHQQYRLHSFKTSSLRGKEGTDNLTDIRKTTRDILDYLTRLTDAQRHNTEVLTEEAEMLLTTPLTDWHKMGIEAANKHSIKPNKALMDLFLGMSVEQQEKLFGIESGDNILDVQIEGTDSNREVLNTLRHHLEYINANPDDHKGIYQRSLVSSNLRLNQYSSTSWQAHKLIRGIFSNFETVFNIDTGAKVGNSNLTEEDMAQITIMRMLDVDKDGPKATLDKFKKRFLEVGQNSERSIDYQGAKIAYEAFNSPDSKAVEKLSKEDYNILNEAIENGGLAMESFTGLVAAGAYLTAREALDTAKSNRKSTTGLTSVDLTMFREDDGIANGIAYTIFAFGINAKDGDELTDLFGRVGVQMKGTHGINERRDEAYKAGNKVEDMYQYFSKPILGIMNRTGTVEDPNNPIDTRLSKVEPSYIRVMDPTDPESVQEADALSFQIEGIKKLLLSNKAVDAVMRDVVKEPLMRYIYGAGNKTILDSVTDLIVKSLIKDFQKLQADYFAKPVREIKDRREYQESVEAKNEMLKALGNLVVIDGKIEVSKTARNYVKASISAGTTSSKVGRIMIGEVVPASKVRKKVPVKSKKGKETAKKKTKTKTVVTTQSEKFNIFKTTSELSAAMSGGVNLLLGSTVLRVIEEKFGNSRAVAGRFNKGITILGEMYAATYNELIKQARHNTPPERNYITKEEMKEVNKQLAKAFPGIDSVITEKLGEDRASLLVIHNSDMKRGKKNHKIVNVNANGNKTDNVYYLKTDLAAEYIVGSPYAIHSMDASAAVAALLADGTMMQVYDGWIQNPLKNDATVASNGQFQKVITSENFSPLTAIADAIEFAAKDMNKLYGYSDKPIKIGALLGTSSKPKTLKSRKYIDDTTGAEMQREFTYEDLLVQFRSIANELATYRRLNKSNIAHVNQYADIMAPPLDDIGELNKDGVSQKARDAAQKAADLSSELELGTANLIRDAAIPLTGEKISKEDRKKQFDLRKRTEGTTGTDGDMFKAYLKNLIDMTEVIVNELKAGKQESQEQAYEDLLDTVFKYDFQSLNADEQQRVTDVLDDVLTLMDLIVQDKSYVVVEEEAVVNPEDQKEPLPNEIRYALNGDQIIFVENPTTQSELENNLKWHGASATAPNVNGQTNNSTGTFTDNAVTEASHVVDSMNIVDLFEDLLRDNPTTERSISQNHTTYLEGLLTNLSGVYTNLGHTVNVNLKRRLDDGGNEGLVNFNSLATTIDINLRNTRGLGSTSISAQEILAHEYVHPFWRFGLNDRSIRTAAIKLFADVNNHPDLDHTVFLRKGDSHTAAEITTAKEHFQHVFRNGKDGLEEFLTFATTNEGFRSNLSSVLGQTITKPTGWFAGLRSLISSLFGFIFGSLKDAESSNASIKSQIDELFVRTTSVVNSAKANKKPNALMTAVGDLTDTSSNKVNDVSNTVLNYLTPDKLLNSDTAVLFRENHRQDQADALERGEVLPVSKLHTFTNLMRDAINTKSEFINDHVRDIAVHMGGDKVDFAELGRLVSKGTTEVDAVSDSLKTAVLEVLNEGFTVEPTLAQHRDITNVIGRTDLSSLYAYNVSNEHLIKQLRGNSDLHKDMQEIHGRITTLVGADTARRINGHVQATSNYMVNENQNKGTTYLNADNILNYVGNIDKNVKHEKVRLKPLVDIYLTLSAVDHSDMDARNRIADMMENVTYSAGITGILNMQRAAATMATETQFDTVATEHLNRKGYYVQNTDPNADIHLAPLAEEADQKNRGFNLIDTTTIPAGMLAQNALVMGVYKRNFGGNKRKSNSAILSTTNKAFGSSVGDLLLQANIGLPSGSVSVHKKVYSDKYKNHLRAVSDGYARGNATPQAGYADVVPSFNRYGYVGSARMTPIDTDFKRKHLGLDFDYRSSLATNIAQLSYKQNAPIHNVDVLNSIVETFNRDFKKHPNDFIRLTPSDPRYKRIVASWDSATHKKMFSAWPQEKGEKVMYIKSNQITGMIGFHAFSPEDIQRNNAPEVTMGKEVVRHLNNAMAFLVNNRFGNSAYYTQTEYVAELAKAIVVKTGVVAYANTISNFLLTGMYGMDPFRTGKKIIENAKYAQDYIKDKREVNLLTVKINQEQASSNPNENNIRKWNSLVGSLLRNMELSPIAPLAESGQLSTVITDPGIKPSNVQSGRGKVRSKFNDSIFSKGILGKGIKEAFMLEDSDIYAFAQEATILTDFVFKQAMFEHNRDVLKMGLKENLAKINYIFFDYNVASPKPIDAMESAGFMMFNKFKMRAPRVAVDAYDTNGTKAILNFYAQTAIAPGSNIFDANFMIGSAEFGNLIQEPYSKVPEIVQMHPGLRILGTGLTEGFGGAATALFTNGKAK